MKGFVAEPTFPLALVLLLPALVWSIVGHGAVQVALQGLFVSFGFGCAVVVLTKLGMRLVRRLICTRKK